VNRPPTYALPFATVSPSTLAFVCQAGLARADSEALMPWAGAGDTNAASNPPSARMQNFFTTSPLKDPPLAAAQYYPIRIT
jgi:hypothetical protein